MNEPDRELATQYVLDELEPRDRALFEARMLVDSELTAFVCEIESAVGDAISHLPPRPLSPDFFQRLEVRLGPVPAKAATIARTGVRRWTVPVAWGIAAVIAFSLATLAVQGFRDRGRPVVIVVGLGANRSTFAKMPLARAANDADERFMQLALLAEKLWREPAGLPHGRPEGGRNYTLFDPASQQGFVAIDQLPPAEPTKRYCLWLVDAETREVIRAGFLPASAGERGIHSFALDSTHSLASDRLNFFVTLEETGPSPAPGQPSDQVVLGSRNL